MAEQPDCGAQVRVVVVNVFSDLMPDTYSDDNPDIEEFFTRFRQWLLLHGERFNDDATNVAGIKYVLSGTALQWYNDHPVGGMPGTLNNVQLDFLQSLELLKLGRSGKMN